MTERDVRLKVAGEASVWTAFVVGIVSIIWGLLGIFGLLNWSWLQNPDRKLDVPVICSGFVLEVLAVLYWRHLKDFKTLQQHIQRDAIQQIAHGRRFVDPRLELVRGEVDALFAALDLLLKQNKYQLADVEKFRSFYIKTLHDYQGREFWATSMPSSKYFWKPNDEVEKATSKFIQGGGRMTRIFFLDSDSSVKAPEVGQILARQVSMGVEVFVVRRREVPKELIRYFVVDTQGDIAWETLPDSDKTISTVWVTAGANHTEEYVRDFKRLKELPCVHKYDPQGTSFGV